MKDQKVSVYATPMEYADGTPRGVVRAFTRVCVVDIFGNQVSRRVSLGTEFSVTLEDAKAKVSAARSANQSQTYVEAEFRVAL